MENNILTFTGKKKLKPTPLPARVDAADPHEGYRAILDRAVAALDAGDPSEARLWIKTLRDIL